MELSVKGTAGCRDTVDHHVNAEFYNEVQPSLRVLCIHHLADALETKQTSVIDDIAQSLCSMLRTPADGRLQ